MYLTVKYYLLVFWNRSFEEKNIQHKHEIIVSPKFVISNFDTQHSMQLTFEKRHYERVQTANFMNFKFLFSGWTSHMSESHSLCENTNHYLEGIRKPILNYSEFIQNKRKTWKRIMFSLFGSSSPFDANVGMWLIYFEVLVNLISIHFL